MDNKFTYEIHPEVEIRVSSARLWRYLINVENWWVRSNPDHRSLSLDHPAINLEEGTRLTIREKIAGIPCKASGVITAFKQEEEVEWKAVYYLLGLKWVRVQAGVAWIIRTVQNSKCRLSARVWAVFPDKFGYRILWYCFRKLLNGIEKDYEHALRELNFIKSSLERNQHP